MRTGNPTKPALTGLLAALTTGTTIGMLAALAAALSVLAAPAAAAPTAGTRSAAGPQASPPTRLWYRISATVTLTKGGDFTETLYTRHNETRARVRLRSRTAVAAADRQCTSLALPRLDPKLLARLATLTRTSTTCAEVRQKARYAGYSPQALRRLRLVDDVRFSANGEGSVDEFERKIEVPAYSVIDARGVVQKQCEAQTLDIARITRPLPVGGELRTASAARDGVSPSIQFPVRLAIGDVETGSEGGPCINPATGQVLTQPRLTTGGFASGSGVFGEDPQYGAVPAPAIARFGIRRRFGRSFGVSKSQELKEPHANGTWITTVETKLTFDVCPRGGRDVAAC